MKNIILTLLLVSFSSIIFGQKNTLRILSERDKSQPVARATIEWGESKGVAADDNGRVTISKAQIGSASVVYISSQGYAMTEVSVKDLLSKKEIYLKEDFTTLGDVIFTPIDAFPLYDNLDKNKEKHFGDYWVSGAFTTETYLFKRNSKTSAVKYEGTLKTSGQVSFKTIASHGYDMNFKMDNINSTVNFKQNFSKYKKELEENELKEIFDIGKMFQQEYVRFSLSKTDAGKGQYFLGGEKYNENKRKIITIAKRNGKNYNVVNHYNVNYSEGGGNLVQKKLLPSDRTKIIKKYGEKGISPKGRYRRFNLLVSQENNSLKELYTKTAKFNSYKNPTDVKHAKVQYEIIKGKSAVSRIDYIRSIPYFSKLDASKEDWDIEAEEILAYTIIKITDHKVNKKKTSTYNNIYNLEPVKIVPNLNIKTETIHFRKNVFRSDFVQAGNYIKGEKEVAHKGVKATLLNELEDI